MLHAWCMVTQGACKPSTMPESVCTVLLHHLVALLLLVARSCLPTAQTRQQQVELLTQGVVHLPLLLTHLKHSCQLCLQQHAADCAHALISVTGWELLLSIAIT